VKLSWVGVYITITNFFLFRCPINVREIPKGQSLSKMDNPEKLATRRRKKKNRKHNTIFVGHHYTETNTNNVIKQDMIPPTNDWRSIQIEHSFYAEIVTDIKMRNSER
jgi:hypothetical protein